MTDNGWNASAQAWIKVIGEAGDWGRQYVLDAPMGERVRLGNHRKALDLGCGEGRFCRLMQSLGITTTGIDPTQALIEAARQRDPTGDYRIESAERLSLTDASVDLIVAYLSLIDIADLSGALKEAHRVLQPGGSLLIANLQPFNTASTAQGWQRDLFGRRQFCIDHYFETRAIETSWRGIHITNWHRPMHVYMQALLELGFVLEHFDEPRPIGVQDAKAERYLRVPNFLVMAWRKR